MIKIAWLSGWCKRRKITINNADILANLTWFPVLVHLSNACGETNQDLTGIFGEVGANSRKIAFTKSDGVTELYAEIEKWNWTGVVATSEAWIWVSKDGWNISSSAPSTTFYIYYDNTHANNPNIGLLADGSVATTGVWDDDFLLVYHLAKTAGLPEDSTSYVNDATAHQLTGQGVAGIIDGEADFEVSNSDYIEEGVGSGDSLKQSFEKLTLETWCKVESNGYIRGIHGRWDTGANQRSYCLYVTASNYMYFALSKNGTWAAPNRNQVRDNITLVLGTQYYHAGVYDGTQAIGATQKLYRNGVNVTTASIADFNGVIHRGTAPFQVGCQDTAGARQRWYDGRQDEVRVSQINRSPAYVKATYETGRDQLLTYGAEENEPAPANPTGLNAVCLTPTSILLTWTDNATNEVNYFVERDDGGWHVISGALPPNTQTYTDNTVICGTAYLYRVRCINFCGTYSAYVTLGAPITCACPAPPEPEPTPEEVEIPTGGRRPIWKYTYVFRHIPSEKIYGVVIRKFIETKILKGKICNWFSEILRTIGKRLADKFQETRLVSALIKKPFEETSPVGCTFIVDFSETRQVLAPITWEFSLTIYAKIMGKITTEEKEYLNELKWL